MWMLVDKLNRLENRLFPANVTMPGELPASARRSP
jgi:hypothetical protein